MPLRPDFRVALTLCWLGLAVLPTDAVAQTHATATDTRPQLVDTLELPVQYPTVFGQRLAYYEAGPSDAPVVILVPSLTWDSHAWAGNLPVLAESFRVISIDPLGTGRSEKPLIDYRMDTWTDTFAEFMRVRGIRRAAFVGAVMGGALAVEMALDHPQLVSAIVVAASNSGPGLHEGAPRFQNLGPNLAGTRASLLEAFYDSTLVTDSVVRARFAQRLSAGDGYTIQRHLADHRAPYSVEELAHIEVPALFVWCREDRTTPLQWGVDYAAALPNGRLSTLERCGHYPNIEQPAAFNRTVVDFLNGPRR